MTNVDQKNGFFATSLDKLAQLSPTGGSSPQSGSLEKLKKRARAKFFTNAYLPHLIELDSPLRKSYVNTIFCSSQLHQKGDVITSTYCGNRWCIVCNRIRIGKAINGYLPELQKLASPQFVTLTIPNMPGIELQPSIAQMVKNWRLMYKQYEKQKNKPVGIRKLECTYNPDEDTYHPHFHLVIEGKDMANSIMLDWLDRYPAANRAAQNVKPADKGSMMELFKYFTKVVTKQKLYVPAMDVIFQSMRGRRVFQPFGISRISEEIDDLESESIEDIDEVDEAFWEWMNCDWHQTDTREELTGYKPSERLLELLGNVVTG